MYNMVDTVIVGRYLGLDALTSVSSTTSITFLIIGFCLGTCTGLAVSGGTNLEQKVTVKCVNL